MSRCPGLVPMVKCIVGADPGLCCKPSRDAQCGKISSLGLCTHHNNMVEVDLRLHCELSGDVECETSSLLGSGAVVCA